MKYLAFIISLTLCGSAFAQFLPDDRSIDWTQSHFGWGAGPNLVMPLQGDFSDTSGNGNGGTPTGSPGFTIGPDGVSGHAVSLNGSTQFVTSSTIENFGSTMTGGCTLQAWVKTTYTNSYEAVISSQAASASNKPICSLYLNFSFANSVAAGNIELVVSDGIHFCFIDAPYNTGICDGNWHLLTVTCVAERKLGSMYIDGSFVPSVTAGTAVTNSLNLTSPVGVGYRAGLNDGLFTGSIADARIYNRQLQAFEVASFYAAKGANLVLSGVPTYSIQYTNMTNIDATGATDVSGSVQFAVSHCPAGQYVALPAGKFLFNSTVSMLDSMVLRGQGTNTIIIDNTTSTQFIINFPGHRNYDSITNIVSGYTKGSTNFVFTSIPLDLVPGMFVQVQQNNDTSLVNQCGIDGCVGDWCFGQWVQVTGISNNTANFWPPLYYTYTNSLTPRIRYPVSISNPNINFTQFAGLENLTLSNQYSASSANINLAYAANCWIKNVVSQNAGVCHIWALDALNCEIRDSVIEGVMAPITSSRGYGIQTGTPNTGLPCEKVTGCLIENNVFIGCRGSIIIGYGAAGNIIGYNYFLNTTNETPSILKMDISIHSAHPYMNLFEGNQGTKINADDFHGSSSHNIAFRNLMRGRDAAKLANSSLTSLELDSWQYYYSLIDNVSGYSTIVAEMAALTSPTGGSLSLAIAPDATWSYNNWYKANMFGYPGEGGGSPADSRVYSTLIMTNNYDFVTNGLVSNTNLNGAIPNSLYLTNVPAWYSFQVGSTTINNIRYPAIGAELSPMTVDIPAKVRFDNGLFPLVYPPPLLSISSKVAIGKTTITGKTVWE